LGGKDPAEYDLICSAHGLPVSIIKAGDPYEKQIEANLSALKIYLQEHGVRFRSVKLAYQSRVGKSAWLEPYLADVLRKPTNLKALLCPIAFTIDNSETLYELEIEYRHIAQKIGYEDFIVAPCFNDDDRFVDFIMEYIQSV
jgi:ferrochelatase